MKQYSRHSTDAYPTSIRNGSHTTWGGNDTAI